MSYITLAWIATVIYGFETIIIKLSSKYAIKNPWLFNILWNALFALLMIPVYISQPVSIPHTWTSLLIASFLSAVCCVLFMIVTYRIDVSILSPLYNVRMGLTVLFAALMLGEHLTPYQVILVGVIVIMGFLVSIDEHFSLKSFFRRDILIAMVFIDHIKRPGCPYLERLQKRRSKHRSLKLQIKPVNKVEDKNWAQ